MNDINLPPFYVGEKIVRVDDCEDSRVKKGDTFVVKDIRWCCNRFGWRVDIGLDTVSQMSKHHCGSCKQIYTHACGFVAARFSSAQQNFQSISYERVMEEEGKLISVN